MIKTMKVQGKYLKLKVKDYKHSESKIEIPEMYRKKRNIGEVVEKGHACTQPVEVGDKVIFKKGGTKLVDEYVLCPELNLLSKFK